MKKILVPCDFSKPAINAFRYALDVAAQSKGSIELLHVVELPVMHDTVLMPVLNFEEELLKGIKEKSEEKFNKIISRHANADGKVTSKVLFGSPAITILDYINNNNIDLVVMGSHGVSGLREIFVGSTTEKILRRSIAPVLVIKNYFKGSVKNIVFPNSLEIENQEELVERVKALQLFFKAKLHLVWINTPASFQTDTITLERLEAFAKHYSLRDYTLNIFNYQNEEDGILAFNKVVKGDLIAMGTSGRTGFSHLLNGSYAENVVNHAKNLIWTYSLKNQLKEA